MKSLGFIAASFIAAVNAATVTFKVVAPSATDTVQVNINGALTDLKATDTDVPYFVGTAEYNLGETYKYVIDGEAEEFDRALNSGDSTRNDFYNRNVTYANIPGIPTILPEGAWTRGDVSHPIWDTNYITSIFVTGKKDDMEDLIENVPTNTYTAKITYIGPDEVYTFEDCTFGLHKPGRKNNDAKQTWVWALPENQYLANRNWFKIRHMEEDPTQLREKLYADISRAMGTYANEANMVRLFINNQGMGTFNMLDDVIMYSYINAMFYGGNSPDKMGGLFDGASGADFNPDTGYDSFIPNVASPLDQDSLAPFAEAIANVDFSNDAEVEAISQYFDYDQFLRFMVMEYLTGSWDGYWQEQTNDGAYVDVESKPPKLYYLGQDFDATFGVNLPFDKSFTEKTVPDYLDQFEGAYLIKKFLENPQVNATFYHYLQTTYEQIFNTRVLEPIVLARHKFYYPDLEWDRSIKQQSPGNIFGWTAEMTYDNLYKAVKAPGGSGGGAEWGLLQWISQIENTCAKFFGNPVTSTLEDVELEDDEEEADGSVEVNKVGRISAASVKNQPLAAAGGVSSTSGARANVPQAVPVLVVLGMIAALF
jgi:hypothetical protein